MGVRGREFAWVMGRGSCHLLSFHSLLFDGNCMGSFPVVFPFCYQIDFFLFCPTDTATATVQSVVSEINSTECSKLNFCKPLGESNK
jgi:hypothetical protein